MTAVDQMVRFDHHSREYALDHRAIVANLRAIAPVAWSESHGGFWIVTDYDDVKRIAEDSETFSLENRVLAGDDARRGVMIPPLPQPLTLNECDPPLHTKRRMIVAPLFTPKYLRGWIEAAAKYTREAINAAP